MPAVLLSALLALGACASGDTGTTPDPSSESSGSSAAPPAPSSSPEAPAPSADEVLELSVEVRDGKVIPAPRRIKVKLGEPIRLSVTTDVDDELHVHGVEIEEPLEAGRTTTVEFRQEQPGQYAAETHEGGLELLQMAVR